MYIKDNKCDCSPYPASISAGSLKISNDVQKGKGLSSTDEGGEVVEQIEVTENLKGAEVTDYYSLSYGKPIHIDTTNLKIHKNMDAEDETDERTADFIGDITIKEDKSTEIIGTLYVKDEETNKFIPCKIQLNM